MRLAAIDCGTNSIRLLIADTEPVRDPAPGQPGVRLTDVVRRNRIVRLGQGVDATGWLAQEALERTFRAAEEYAELIREHGAEQLRFVATSATRDAGNRHAFIDGIRQRLEVEPEVISGDEEAALSFAGASLVAAPTGQDRTLVVDIGGGSTEFVLGSATGILAERSVNIGSVRMTERHLGSTPPTAAQRAAVVEQVDRALDLVEETVPLSHATCLVGLAGAVTTLTAHALQLESYDADRINGAELTSERFRAACEEIIGMTRQERARLPYMHPGRVDVIAGGALIWERVLQRLEWATQGRVVSATTSEHDILDGIALSLA